MALILKTICMLSYVPIFFSCLHLVNPSSKHLFTYLLYVLIFFDKNYINVFGQISFFREERIMLK